MFVDRGVDLEQAGLEGTPLILAVRTGMCDVVELLVKAGAYTEATDSHGLSARQYCLGQAQGGVYTGLYPVARLVLAALDRGRLGQLALEGDRAGVDRLLYSMPPLAGSCTTGRGRRLCRSPVWSSSSRACWAST